MTFEQMKIFLEAAHFGSFTHAAERLGLTQSAVSVSIKKLEEKHDVALFDRSGRRLVLTEAGQVLLNEAERILRDLELTARRVESRRRTSHSSLLACTGNAYDFWMPELLGRVGATHPMEVELLRGTTDEVTAWVMRGTADAGVTSAMPSHPQFRQVGVFADRLVLCACPERARDVPHDLTWAQVADYAPIVWEQSELTQTLFGALTTQRLDPSRLTHRRLKLSSSMAVISILRGGHHIGFVPERAVSPYLASGTLTRVGLLEVPVRYWMFALRERNIDLLAAQVARAASSEVVFGGAENGLGVTNARNVHSGERGKRLNSVKFGGNIRHRLLLSTTREATTHLTSVGEAALWRPQAQCLDCGQALAENSAHS